MNPWKAKADSYQEQNCADSIFLTPYNNQSLWSKTCEAEIGLQTALKWEASGELNDGIEREAMSLVQKNTY